MVSVSCAYELRSMVSSMNVCMCCIGTRDEGRMLRVDVGVQRCAKVDEPKGVDLTNKLTSRSSEKKSSVALHPMT